MLYQNARPTKLEEMVGNKLTIDSIKNILKKDVKDQPHVILLYGPTGCGKTTLARIIASELGCNELSILEINAANTRGIDSTRDIAKDAFIRPMVGDAKVYIFDESQQLTRAAQEALLKILEDHPMYCYFIFCTTSPENIIKTIINRCSDFQLSLLGEEDVIQLLSNCCKKFSLNIREDVLQGIAYVCEGSPRSALILLEKVIGLDDEEEVFEILNRGTDNQVDIWDLCNLLIMEEKMRVKRWKSIFKIFGKIDEDSESVRRAINTFLMRQLLTCDDDEQARNLAKLMNIFSSSSSYYGGTPFLTNLIAKACFGEEVS